MKIINSSPVGQVHDLYVTSEVTETEAVEALVGMGYRRGVARELVSKWGNQIKSAKQKKQCSHPDEVAKDHDTDITCSNTQSSPELSVLLNEAHSLGIISNAELETISNGGEKEIVDRNLQATVGEVVYSGPRLLVLASNKQGLNSKEKNMRKRFAIQSARGEVSDSTRQLVRDILDQVPALVKVPEKQQGIKKEPYGLDHVCYFYTEEGPRKGSNVTVEFHVDPSDLYTDVFVTTRASFAAAADDEDAHQDDREVTLDEFVIEDLEDYSLADIDKIDAAVAKGFEGAKKFDEKAASTIESRKALFSSKHKRFVKSGKTRIFSSLENEVDHWVNTVGCISEMPEDERNDLLAVADHVASKIEDVESLGYSDDPKDSVRLVNDIADIIQKKGWLVSSGKITSEIPGLERYIQEIMEEEGVTREEAEEIARERISVGI